MKRKPKIEYYWVHMAGMTVNPAVNWRLVGANGEVMCQSTQGFRDKTDARRSVDAVTSTLFGRASPDGLEVPREVGPGRKPK